MTDGSNRLRLIWEPNVYVVGRQVIDDPDLWRFLADEGAGDWRTDAGSTGEKLIEVAGRLCYASYTKPRPGGNKAYIGHLLEVGHGSVLEHAVFNLILTGVSRSLTHELVRHRAGWGFSQLSQRFVDESDVSFVVPPALADEVHEANLYHEQYRSQPECSALDFYDGLPPSAKMGLAWLAKVEAARSEYARFGDWLTEKYGSERSPALRTERRKMAREAARSLLPNATETKIFVTFNARSARTFFQQRATREADAEMRRLAVAMLRRLKAEVPSVFDDFEIVTSPDGVEYATSKYHKV